MGILAVNKDPDAAFRQMLVTMTGGEQTLALVEPAGVHGIHTHVAALVLGMLNRARREIVKAAGAAPGGVAAGAAGAAAAGGLAAAAAPPTQFINPLLPLEGLHSLCPIGDAIKQTASLAISLENGGGSRPDAMFRVSARGATLPDAAVADAPAEDAEGPARKAAAAVAAAQLIEYTSKLQAWAGGASSPAPCLILAPHHTRHPLVQSEGADVLRRAATLWDGAAASVGAESAALAAAFEDVAFPFTRFTRRRAAYKGSSLYLPGLIKAIGGRAGLAPALVSSMPPLLRPCHPSGSDGL